MISVVKVGSFFQVSVALGSKLFLTPNELAELYSRCGLALAIHHQSEAVNNDATGLFHVPAEMHVDPRCEA